MADPVNILNKLFLALQNIRFYPPSHSLVQEGISALHALLGEALAAGQDFTFGFVENKLMVNGKPVEGVQTRNFGIARHFEILHIDSITIKPGLTQTELHSFLECMSIKPEHLNESGGLKKAIADKGLHHIRAGEVTYGRITKEDFAREPEHEKRREKTPDSDAGENFIRALRMADGGRPAVPSDSPAPSSRPTRMPSPQELEELYTIRDRFDAELKKRVREATERLAAENTRLAFEKEKMDTIMRNVGEGVVVVGNDGNILMANPAAEKLLGRADRKNVVGQTLKETLREEHSLIMSKNEVDAIQEIEVLGKNEETRRVLRASNAIIEDRNGRTIGMVSVLSDITKMKEIEQVKSDFVANVSHELRSPLAAIQKNLAVILDESAGKINSDQKEFLALAKENLDRLHRLVNDLLDLSKIEAGKMELKKTRVDLKELVHKAVLSFSGWFAEKHMASEVEVPPEPVEVNADADRISQVLHNLLSNALKYTPAGGKIRVKLRAGERVEVSVADSGVGIAQKDLGRIFKRFEQVSSAQTAGVAGTGLGLPLAKEIIEKHGGCLTAASEEGKGSVFTFSLPR